MGEVRDRVLKGVGRIRNLPTMPENASRLMMALSDDRSDSKRIAALLMRDVAIRFLRMRGDGIRWISRCI